MTDGSGAAAGGALTQAQVETIVDDKARWTAEKVYDKQHSVWLASFYPPIFSIKMPQLIPCLYDGVWAK